MRFISRMRLNPSLVRLNNLSDCRGMAHRTPANQSTLFSHITLVTPHNTLPSQKNGSNKMTELQNLPPGSVDILTLSAPQLSSLQSRLSQELEHLTTSYTRLRSAQARFRDCIASIKTGVNKQADRTSAPLFCQLLQPLPPLSVPSSICGPTQPLQY